MPEGACDRAYELDRKLERHAAAIILPSFKEILAHIRVYLLKQDAETGNKNNIYQILKETKSGDIGFITLGPPFDTGPTDSHYYLGSGARLSFGITLRNGNGRCSIITYRFHLHMVTGPGPEFYRFDLNAHAHSTPLNEPRSHLHPGRDDIRLPFPVLSPFEILDRIFCVIEGA